MQFAEEHEQEAEAVEQEVAGGGAGPSAADKAKAESDLRELVTKRVYDMLAEAGRIGVMRGGPDLRRP
jgi:hypothetical protein